MTARGLAQRLTFLIALLLTGCTANQINLPAISGSLAITPNPPAMVTPGQTIAFQATKGGAPYPDATWSLLPNDGSAGTISDRGVYVSPSTGQSLPQASKATVFATDTASSSMVSVTFSLTSVAPVLTAYQPASLIPGEQATLILTGSNLDTISSITLNGTSVVPQNVSATQITATYTVPLWASGSEAVTATSSVAGESTSNTLNIPVTPPLVAYDAASRFLSQATWGPTDTTIQQVQRVGFSAYLDQQLGVGPDNFVEDNDPGHDAMSLFDQARDRDDNQLRTKMAWIWWKLYSTPGSVIAWLTTSVPQTVDRDAFGSFETLLTDVTLNPVMGSTLNYDVADPAGNPNLNYARESMQLFSVGPILLNPDGTAQHDSNGMQIPAYQYADIAAIARAVTGFEHPPSWDHGGDYYGIDPLVSPSTVWQHDEGGKTLLGVDIPGGQTATQDTKAVVHILASHPNTAQFIGKYLIHELVTSNPSPAYVSRVSAVWNDDGNGNRGNLGAVIKAILLDPEARAGDTPSGLTADEGRFRDLVGYAAFVNRVLGNNGGHTSSVEFSFTLGQECVWTSPSVFSFYQQQTTLPNSSTLAPEYQLFNEPSIQGRASFLNELIYMPDGDQHLNNLDWNYWGQLTAGDGSEYIDFVNHHVFHGMISPSLSALLQSDAEQYSDPEARAQQMMMDTFLSPEAQVQR